MDQAWRQSDVNDNHLLPNRLPVTPSGKSHIEIDQIVRRLAIKHDLLLPERCIKWSPSKSGSSTPESCYSCVKYLYFAGRPALYRAITDFEESVSVTDNREQRLKKLLKCLEEEKWIIKNAIHPQPSFSEKVTQTHQKQQSSTLAEPFANSKNLRSFPSTKRKHRRKLLRPYLNS